MSVMPNKYLVWETYSDYCTEYVRCNATGRVKYVYNPDTDCTEIWIQVYGRFKIFKKWMKLSHLIVKTELITTFKTMPPEDVIAFVEEEQVLAKLSKKNK